MNISLNNNDADNSGILKMEIVKADYADKVEKRMRNLRQKVALPGFRKGMVPMELLRKTHGTQVLIEEVNRMVSESLVDYLQENKLDILGEPMPNITEQKELNFETQEDFEFCFDLAFVPEIKISINKRDKLHSYNVLLDDKPVDEIVESYRAKYGTYEDVDDEIQEKDLLKGVLTELENCAAKDGGIVVEDAVLMPFYFKNDVDKAKFVGANKSDVVVFNPAEAYEGANAEIASLLKISKEQAGGITSDFSFEITGITRFKEAELNQAFFEKVFGEESMDSEESFRLKIKNMLIDKFAAQAEYKYHHDLRDFLIKKVGKLVLADDVLKRWIIESGDKEPAPGEIDANYPNLIKDLTYDLVKAALIKEYHIEAEEKDVKEFAIRLAKVQFAQYGMLSVPQTMLDNYVKEMLKDKQTVQRIITRVSEGKMGEIVKGLVKFDVRDITVEEFEKIFPE